MKRVSLAATVGALALVPASANAFDPILHWTDTSNALIRSLNQTRACPCPISRGVAMMYLAMYDAVNSIDGTHEPYLVDLNAPPGASMEAAAVMAAHDVLLSIYPIRQGMLDNAMNADLALIPDGQSKTDGIAIGHAAAQAIIAARTGDGSSIDPTYGGENSIGHWHPTWPDFRTGCHSMWGHVTPFGLTAGNQFLPPAPPALTSQQYTDAFNEVKLYGSEYGDEANTYQREIAYFWANDQDGTSKPPGQLCDMFKIISQLQGLGTVENARLFAYLGMCLGDAGIACWDSKYDTDLDFWRPISGIREADADGNPNTLADPEWVPLCHFTPNFPAYTSGHSTFGGAASQLLRRYFGFDDFTWTQTTDDPHLDAGWTREMHSFTQAEVENHDSRIWLGVHWRFDCDAGVALGHHLADWAFDNYLRPVNGGPGTSSVGPNGRVIELLTIAPNPTWGATQFRFALTEPGQLGVAIFDAQGRVVRTLDSRLANGSSWVAWDGMNTDRRPVAPGVYFVRGVLNGQPVDPSAGSRLVVLR